MKIETTILKNLLQNEDYAIIELLWESAENENRNSNIKESVTE